MADNRTYAINNSVIDNTIVEIMSISEEIQNLFNKIDSIMEKTSRVYTCESATKLRKNYSVFRENYPIIISNLLSYGTDMTSLKKKYQTNTEILVENLKIASGKIDIPEERKEER